ncbi:MAG: PadR family transcriptional regulator [Pseudomonadota bacterium]
MQKEKQRNPAEFPVLGMLYTRPAHGYDLCRKLRQQLGEIWTLRTSHIYALLAGLERDGLVRHNCVEQGTRPAKKVFTITDKGRLVFWVWVRSPVMNVRDIRLEFLTKLHFARLDSFSTLEDLIANQLNVCRSGRRRLKKVRVLSETETEAVGLDFRVAMLSAAIRWLERLLPSEVREDAGRMLKEFPGGDKHAFMGDR